MGSEFNNWYEKWTGSKVKCENTDIIGAWQHQQSKVDELTKQRDSFIKAYEIEIDKSIELQKRVDAALQLVNEMKGKRYPFSAYADQLEQALKGGQ